MAEIRLFGRQLQESTEYVSDFTDFESDYGNWYNAPGNVSDWIRDSGSTPSSSTGPTGGFSSAVYVYIECSGSGSGDLGDENILEYDLNGTKTGVISFRYHQYGSNQGTLRFEALIGGNWVELFKSVGNQGSVWLAGSASYTNATKLRFRNTAAGGFRGDVALDAIEVEYEETVQILSDPVAEDYYFGDKQVAGLYLGDVEIFTSQLPFFIVSGNPSYLQSYIYKLDFYTRELISFGVSDRGDFSYAYTRGIAYDKDSTYIVGAHRYTRKYDNADMSLVMEYVNNGNSEASQILEDGDYIYTNELNESYQDVVTKVRKSDLLRVAYSDIQPRRVYSMAMDRSYIYAGTYLDNSNTEGEIRIYDKNTLNRVGIINTPTNYPKGLVVDSGYIYSISGNMGVLCRKWDIATHQIVSEAYIGYQVNSFCVGDLYIWSVYRDPNNDYVVKRTDKATMTTEEDASWKYHTFAKTLVFHKGLVYIGFNSSEMYVIDEASFSVVEIKDFNNYSEFANDRSSDIDVIAVK